MADQLTKMIAEFHDNSPETKSQETYKTFRAELVQLVNNDEYPLIEEADVYREPSSSGALIQVMLVVKGPVSAAVKQADLAVETAASAAGVKISSEENTSDMGASYESDGMTLVPA